MVVLLALVAGMVWLQWRPDAPRGVVDSVEQSTAPAGAMEVAIDAPPSVGELARTSVEIPSVAPASAQLDAVGSLRIVVHYADGDPAPDVGLTVRESLREVPNPLFRRLRTDDVGQVRVAELRPGVFIVWTDRQAMQHKQVDVVAGTETEFVLELEPGIDLSGIVVNDVDAPVADALVVVAGWAASEPRAICRTDASGRFSLRQVSRMTNVTARAVGYAPAPFHSVTAGAGAEVDVRIVLSGAGGSVHGQVFDPSGQPVADASVAVGETPAFGRVITLPDGSKGMYAPRAQTRTDSAWRC